MRRKKNAEQLRVMDIMEASGNSLDMIVSKVYLSRKIAINAKPERDIKLIKAYFGDPHVSHTEVLLSDLAKEHSMIAQRVREIVMLAYQRIEEWYAKQRR